MDKELKAASIDHMNKAIDFLRHELASIRTGRASVALLDTIKVDYYGSKTPLNHVANVSVPDAKNTYDPAISAEYDR